MLCRTQHAGGGEGPMRMPWGRGAHRAAEGLVSTTAGPPCDMIPCDMIAFIVRGGVSMLLLILKGLRGGGCARDCRTRTCCS